MVSVFGLEGETKLIDNNRSLFCILQSCVYKSLLLFLFNVIVSSPAVNHRVYNKKNTS